jgi:DNA-binding response OmpR family regulator
MMTSENQTEKRVMVVDDARWIREGVKVIFETAGLGAIAVASGRDCIEEMAKGFRGVILMDIDMPSMDGWDTIREMVSRGYVEGNIICMLAGWDVPDEGVEGLQEHVLDYITKPFDPEELVTTVRGYLSRL